MSSNADSVLTCGVCADVLEDVFFSVAAVSGLLADAVGTCVEEGAVCGFECDGAVEDCGGISVCSAMDVTGGGGGSGDG